MTLTEFSYYSRKLLPLAVIGIIVFFLFFFMLRIILLSSRPAPKTALVYNTTFGKLPKLILQHSIPPPPQLSFVLDNIEGRPTTSTSAAKIFFIPPKNTRFGYLQNIYLMARSFGFDTEVIKHRLEGQTAIFDDGRATLSIDISSLNYEFSYNFQSHPEIFADTTIPDESVITDRAKEFMRLVGKYPDELTQGTTHVIYLTYNSETQSLETTNNPKKANVAEIDFFRPNVDDYPIVSPKFFNSSNFVTIVFNGTDYTNYKVIKSRGSFFEKDNENVGLYPIKTGDAAWAELNKGKATIVSPGGKSYPIKIKEMFVGYFDPDDYQQYLQPVYVFLGENNFAAYVPAVDSAYVE